jgi:hypothetical protein
VPAAEREGGSGYAPEARSHLYFFTDSDATDTLGGQAVQVSTTDVEGHDDPVCGTDAIKVHFSFFGEDSDRESPTFNTSTGAGVYPEHL